MVDPHEPKNDNKVSESQVILSQSAAAEATASVHFMILYTQVTHHVRDVQGWVKNEEKKNYIHLTVPCVDFK